MVIIMRYNCSGWGFATTEPYAIYEGTLRQAKKECEKLNKKTSKFDYEAVKVKILTPITQGASHGN